MKLELLFPSNHKEDETYYELDIRNVLRHCLLVSLVQ